MPKCPHCGTFSIHDLGDKCPNCGADLKPEARALDAKLQKELGAILLVTTPAIEGARVIQYLGVVSAEVVLGTGLLSELGADLADFFGGRASEFQNKLAEAKEAAMNELRKKAHAVGGNTVLGVDLDYSVIKSNMLMVVANGTAVKLAPFGLP
jgi:uncharacterized protein YbjQ (UPF0145 family)